MDLREVVTKRLDVILGSGSEGRGPMWGGPEAYELQVLQLLELLYFPEDDHAFKHSYSRFIAQRLPAVGCRSISALISDHTVLTTELSAFRAFLERRQPAA